MARATCLDSEFGSLGGGSDNLLIERFLATPELRQMAEQRLLGAGDRMHFR